MKRLPCPACGNRIILRDDYKGQSVKCPNCEVSIPSDHVTRYGQEHMPEPIVEDYSTPLKSASSGVAVPLAIILGGVIVLCVVGGFLMARKHGKASSASVVSSPVESIAKPSEKKAPPKQPPTVKTDGTPVVRELVRPPAESYGVPFQIPDGVRSAVTKDLLHRSISSYLAAKKEIAELQTLLNKADQIAGCERTIAAYNKNDYEYFAPEIDKLEVGSYGRVPTGCFVVKQIVNKHTALIIVTLGDETYGYAILSNASTDGMKADHEYRYGGTLVVSLMFRDLSDYPVLIPLNSK